MSELVKTMKITRKAANSNHEKILMITKDDEGNKHHNFIEKPQRSFHILKPDYWDGELRVSASKDMLDEYTTFDKDKVKSIVKALDDPKVTQHYNAVMSDDYSSTRYRALQKIEKDYRVFRSDSNIEDEYIAKYSKRHEEDQIAKTPITKGFWDIEVDGSKVSGFPQPEQALAPINIITYLDDHTSVSYTFALKYDTDTYRDAMADNGKKVKDALAIKYKGRNLKFEIFEYNDEISLIADYFRVVNNITRPDFMSAWNASFDFQTTYNRILRNNYEPEQIMCPEDFKYKSVFMKLDKNANGPDTQSDTFDVASYTTYIDSFTLYANLTKIGGQMESFALDAVGQKEVGEKKDDFEGNISTLHYDDYFTFIMYNIQDVVLLRDIENKVKHIDLISMISKLTLTRVTKVTKKTISLRNFADDALLKIDKVISNNHSDLYEVGKIPGAFVADPNLLDNIGLRDATGMKSSRIIEFAMDMDLSAMYPTNIIAANICPESRVGGISFTARLDKSKYVSREDLLEDTKTETGEFVDDYVANSPLNFAPKYFGVPNVSKMIDEIDKAFPRYEEVGAVS